jgi:hypothetical protein
MDLNMNLLKFILDLIPDLPTFQFTEEYIKTYPDTILDWRKGVPCDEIQKVNSALPSYTQIQRIGKSFQSNLSILDVLCHQGPDTIHYLARYAELYAPTA